MQAPCASLLASCTTLVSLYLGASPLGAQANADAQLDGSVSDIGSLQTLAREGLFPTGSSALAAGTTVCNGGSAPIAWSAPMAPAHPVFAFTIVRESQGRLRQISKPGFVRHGFFALPQNSCDTCTNASGSSALHAGCSTSNSASVHGDRFWLAPADEVDPWLGTWTPECSLFDAGLQPVDGQQCDGVRSLTIDQTAALGGLEHRVMVADAELAQAGTFWFSAQLVIAGEPVAARLDNLATRCFTPLWTGASWNFGAAQPTLAGSVLERWSSVDLVAQNTNGSDDGRVWVAVDVQPVSAGLWHYEYALQNADNARGCAALRIPFGAGTTWADFGFADVDGNPVNDWTASFSDGQLTVGAASNALTWGTIYNVWFDATAAPVSAPLTLEQALAGPGLAEILVDSLVPGATQGPSFYCTAKASSAGCLAHLASEPLGLQPASGAADLTLLAQDVQGLKNGLLFYGLTGPAALAFHGGTLCVSPPLGRTPIQNSAGSAGGCDGTLAVLVNAGVLAPSGPDAGPGASSWMQGWYRDPQNGPGNLGTALTDAVQLDFAP